MRLVDIAEHQYIPERDFQMMLKQLLLDRATKKNIVWATPGYEALGDEFACSREILPRHLLGEYSSLILPRIAKEAQTQDSRTRQHAEVFTPSWVCNAQNNLVDEQWFGRVGVFNTEKEKAWEATTGRIEFPEAGPRTWKKYVDTKRLEITCGEAPYLVSRYDTVTGDEIPIGSRIGLLDRKLRVVNENTETEQEWKTWALRAVQSVYGYEFQGDNLVLARENLLLTYIEYYLDRFRHWPDGKTLITIARVISWNLWQMDGLKFVAPYSCKTTVIEEYTFFGVERTEQPCPGCKTGDNRLHNGVYCRIYDWRKDNSLEFRRLMKGGKL